MNNYILYQLELHCRIYNLNYEEYNKKFLNNDFSISLLKEFDKIYNKDELKSYDFFLNNTFKNINDIIYNVRRDEKEILNVIALLKNFNFIDFFSWFFSFSILNGLLYEKFSYDTKIESNSIELISLINFVCNDLFLLINFLYVNNIIIENENNFNERSIKKFLLRIIIILKNENILKFKKVTVVKENNTKSSLRYANMIEFENYSKPKSLTYLFKISHEPATVKKKNEIILIGFNHYSLNTYLISNKKGKKKSIIKDEFIKTIENKAKTSFYIDKEMLNIVNNVIINNDTINIENNLKNLKTKYAIKQQEVNKKDNELEELFDEFKYLKYQIKKIQKSLSLGIDIWIFNEFKKIYYDCLKPIYFIPYSDFRGRIYFKSLVSPNSNWMFRFLYNFGKMEKLIENDLGILLLNNTIKDELKTINIKENLTIYSWILLSIGVKFKKDLKLIGGKIKIDEFILIGIKKYKEYSENYITIFKIMENMDAIETIYYITLINNLKNNILYKRYIIKDTTASVYQHLGKILLFKDEKALEITNITGENQWYDTYEPLINELKLSVEPEIKEYFYRKSLKPVFITTKYNIGWSSALNYYLNELGYIKNENLFKKIIKGFSEIYRNLKKGEVEKKILYKMSLKEFNEKILNYKNIELEDISISLIYYKMKKKEINIFINKNSKTRHTMANYEISEELDIIQMQRAALPHIVHGLDALYARRILNLLKEFDVEIFTIHDAFAVPFNQIDLLIISAWDSIKIEEKFNFIEKTNNKVKANSVSILI